MILRGQRTGIIHILTMDVEFGYKNVEKFRGGLQWYIMRSIDFFSSISFKIENENNQMTSNGQTKTFRLSIGKV